MELLLVCGDDVGLRIERSNVYRISCYPESEEWSTIKLFPQIEDEDPGDGDGGGGGGGGGSGSDSDSDSGSDSFVLNLMSSVHGLLCLGVDVGEIELDYGFWNPSTDEYQFLPYPDSRFLPCTCSSTQCLTSVVNSSFGLGFVAESQDYKFVRFMANFYEVGDNGLHATTSKHVAVYSSKNNSWKELPFPYDAPAQGADATYVNGFCYWISSKDVILSFDLSTDKFSSLPCPDDIERYDFSIIEDVFLIEMDGSLCLVIQFQLLNDSEKKAIATKLFSFWVYESSSPSQWTRKINLDVRIAAERPVWLGKKNNNSLSLVLLLQGLDGALLEYNYATTELKKIDQIQDHHPGGIMMISPYVETNIAEKDNDGVDRISQLPDHIILIILSLLSLKEAASTSVLSTCWRDLWRHIPNLIFPNTDHAMMRDTDMYTKWVNSVVELHRAPSFKEFSISLPLNDSIRQNTVTKWLELAFSRGVEVLVLNLVGTRFGFLEKTFLLKSTNLTSLTLKCMKVSGESISLLLRSCPLLELLIIKYAVLESDLEVCGSLLRHLDIQYCRGGKSIKGYAPNLTYLRFDSGPKLCTDYRKQSPHDPPLIRLISSKLTTLEFTLHSPKIFLEQGFPQMATLRKLIVTYYDVKCSIVRPIASLLRALPYLEELEIKQQHYISSSYLFKKQGVKAVNNIESFCHCHLKVFKFEVGNADRMELTSYILDNCFALEKIILYNFGCSGVVEWEYVKQLQSKLTSTIQLITS